MRNKKRFRAYGRLGGHPKKKIKSKGMGGRPKKKK